VGQTEKDNAAEVARGGFEALIAGKDHVVAGSFKNKIDSRRAAVDPGAGAEIHGKQAERDKEAMQKQTAALIKQHCRPAFGYSVRMEKEQASFLLSSIYLPTIRNEQRITASVIDAIPAAKCDYRPDEISKSAMELAWHITSTEMRFMDAVAAGEFDLNSTPRPASIRTPADLTAWYKENSERRLCKLEDIPADQLVKTIDFRGRLQLPAVMYLNIMLHHSVHHRGQLSAYLRPMGAKVPAIYGESHDSAQARMAAQKA
jgi:uncharacterized damage-inducible protein DinB